MKNTLLLTLFLLISKLALAQEWTISGKITDVYGNAIPFVSVFIKGTTKGVSANVDGHYQIKVDKSNMILIFSSIGYQIAEENIAITTNNITLNKILNLAQYTLNDVVIRSDAEDPAYRIIRQAIKHRKKHLNEINSFQVDVYIKGFQKLIAAPKKFLGRDMQKTLSLDSNRSGILYLSESQSKFSFQKSDKIKEEMISSKVSGRNNAFSFNKASDVRIDFYENLLLENSGLSSRSFVSPIADNALFYYRYKLLGTTEESGKTIYKIEVYPKRKNDPVFRGLVYIVDEDWHLKSVDLKLVKDAGINFIDTLQISQNFIQQKQYYVPSNLKFSFNGNVFGFKFKGYFVSVMNNYEINKQFPKNYFTSEILKITKSVNEKDSIYWAENRPIPLTDEERRDYTRKDSIALRKQSKTYLDSLEKANNKFTLGKILLTSYQHNDRFNRSSFTFDPLITAMFFNTVEGVGLKYGITYRKRYEDRRSFSVRPEVRYGAANETLSANLSTNYIYNPQMRAAVGLDFGSSIEDMNYNGTMSLFANTINTLFYEVNYPKFYRKDFIKLHTRREIANGLQASLSYEYAQNSALLNHNLFTFRDLRNLNFTSNNPFDPMNNTLTFPTYRSSTVQFNLVYSIGQKYMTLPDAKIYTPSKYPKLILNYRKGFKNAFGGQSDYDLLSFDVVQEQINGNLLGKSTFALSVGGFLNDNMIYYPEFKHFMGNNAAFFPPNLRKFSYLDFYHYSTKQRYFEAHFEHNFGGFLLNKVPVLRKLKFEEVVGLNYLTQPQKKNYNEFYFGIRRLFFGLSYGFAFNGTHKVAEGIRYNYITTVR